MYLKCSWLTVSFYCGLTAAQGIFPDHTSSFFFFSSSWSTFWLRWSDIFISHDFYSCFCSNIPQIWFKKVCSYQCFLVWTLPSSEPLNINFAWVYSWTLKFNWWTFCYRFVKLLAWFMAIVQSLLIIASRKHYSVDVVVAWYDKFSSLLVIVIMWPLPLFSHTFPMQVYR